MQTHHALSNTYANARSSNDDGATTRAALFSQFIYKCKRARMSNEKNWYCNDDDNDNNARLLLYMLCDVCLCVYAGFVYGCVWYVVIGIQSGSFYAFFITLLSHAWRS